MLFRNLLLLTICSVFIGINANCQTYNKIISDDEYHEFINKDLARDSIKVVHHILKKQLNLDLNTFYFKDSADYLKKNNNIKNKAFIFRHYTTTLGYTYSNKLDSIFKREDIDFLGLQIKNMTNIHTWTAPFTNSVLIDEVEYEECQNCLGGIKPKYGVWLYSLPLFTKDRQFALIIKENTTINAFYLYKRTSTGDWVLIKRFNESFID